MKLTLFNFKETCATLGEFKISHITMFDRDMSISIHFTDKTEQLNFISCCIENHVLIQLQGTTVTLIHEKNNLQRVRFRFDNNIVAM